MLCQVPKTLHVQQRYVHSNNIKVYTDMLGQTHSGSADAYNTLGMQKLEDGHAEHAVHNATCWVELLLWTASFPFSTCIACV